MQYSLNNHTTKFIVAYLLKDGGTALHRAASNGHDEVVTLLINAGAPVNAQDFVSFTSHIQETALWLFKLSNTGRKYCSSSGHIRKASKSCGFIDRGGGPS
jgi:hypothetical protein